MDWNCNGFDKNCLKRKHIAKYIFTSKEHNLHEDTPMHIHNKNEHVLGEITSYQNLIREREDKILENGYFTQDEIIKRRTEQIQKILDYEVLIDESIYKDREYNDSIELALGFWNYRTLYFKKVLDLMDENNHY